MSYFTLLDNEQSEAWVNGFPQLAKSGLTAPGENVKQGLTQGLQGGLNHLALGLVVSTLVLGGAYVYVGSGASTCAAVRQLHDT